MITAAAVSDRVRIRSAEPAVRVLFVAAAYYLGAQIGLLPALVREQVSPFWPPTGIAVASLFLLGTRVWPGITLGAFAANAPLGPSLLAVSAISVGNTLAPVVSVWLLRRAGFRPDLRRLRDGMSLILLGALVGMAVSATVGSTALHASGAELMTDFWSTWSVWWTGDAMGVLVIAPVLFLLPRLSNLGHLLQVGWRRYAELAVVLIVIELVALYTTARESPALLLITPMLVWAATRFRLAGAATAVLAVSVTAVHAAARGWGYFGSDELLPNMMTLQIFNGSAAFTALLLAAAIAQRDESRQQLAEANRLLERRVDERGAQLAHDRSRMAVLADRHRIATELHDVVIQRLFGTGATLEAIAASVKDDTTRRRLDQAVHDLDETIVDLRASIFGLDANADAASLHEAVAHVLGAASHSLGFLPTLSVHGAQERIPLPMRSQLLGTLQEVLADIGHRAEATRADVDLTVLDDEFVMTIRDSGSSPRHPEPHTGVRLARDRAARLGGSCQWQVNGTGTVFEWRLPFRRPRQAGALGSPNLR